MRIWPPHTLPSSTLRRALENPSWARIRFDMTGSNSPITISTLDLYFRQGRLKRLPRSTPSKSSWIKLNQTVVRKKTSSTQNQIPNKSTSNSTFPFHRPRRIQNITSTRKWGIADVARSRAILQGKKISVKDSSQIKTMEKQNKSQSRFLQCYFTKAKGFPKNVEWI